MKNFQEIPTNLKEEKNVLNLRKKRRNMCGVIFILCNMVIIKTSFENKFIIRMLCMNYSHCTYVLFYVKLNK